MTAQTKSVIKSYFQRGLRPTQAQYGDLIDSYLDVGASAAVTNSMLAPMSAVTIKSNVTSAAAQPADNSLTSIIDASLGSTQGQILYRDSLLWRALATGTFNQKLFAGGAGANPFWGSGFKTGVFTRDVSLATGTQSVTGVGFMPSAIIILASIDLTPYMSIGISDGVLARSIRATNAFLAGSYSLASSIVNLFVDLSNSYSGNIASFDSDGFTISWSKQGTPTGTASLMYFAMR